MTIPWWGYVVLAGLAWGVYVPLIFFGGSELGGKPNARLMAILCVGVAYFVLAVVFPLGLFLSGQQEWPKYSQIGLVFAGLAGVAGAAGAICVVFASSAAVAQARGEVPDGLTPTAADLAKYRVYIAPLIFGLAPVINALVSTVWHPTSTNWAHFEPKSPSPLFLVGIVLIGVGVALVLYSKEAGEIKPGPTPPNPSATQIDGPTPATAR